MTLVYTVRSPLGWLHFYRRGTKVHFYYRTVTREVFIRTAFADFKWIEAGLGDLVKVTLDNSQTLLAGIKDCCFRTTCPKKLQGREHRHSATFMPP